MADDSIVNNCCSGVSWFRLGWCVVHLTFLEMIDNTIEGCLVNNALFLQFSHEHNVTTNNFLSLLGDFRLEQIGIWDDITLRITTDSGKISFSDQERHKKTTINKLVFS